MFALLKLKNPNLLQSMIGTKSHNSTLSRISKTTNRWYNPYTYNDFKYCNISVIYDFSYTRLYVLSICLPFKFSSKFNYFLKLKQTEMWVFESHFLLSPTKFLLFLLFCNVAWIPYIFYLSVMHKKRKQLCYWKIEFIMCKFQHFQL